MNVLDLFSAAAGGWSLGMHRALRVVHQQAERRFRRSASRLVEAFGDAVVPQIPEAIGRAILRTERAISAVYSQGIAA